MNILRAISPGKLKTFLIQFLLAKLAPVNNEIAAQPAQHSTAKVKFIVLSN
jgi:hypothetical protein